jgi:GDP-L-fucose synthase
MIFKVLITGANGFVGKHVVRELQNDYELLTPSSRELNLVNPVACSGVGGVPIHYGYPIPPGYPERAWTVQGIDALVAYLLRHEIDAIVHLAAVCGGIGINKDNPGKFLYENLQMGANVLEAARQVRVKKVVNLGTVCAYPKFTPVPFQEEDIWNGYPEETNAPYGIAKKTVMEMGRAYHAQYGMDVTNLVPVNMCGEWDKIDLYSSHVIPALIRKFEDAQPAIHPFNAFDDEPRVVLWGTGSASREFLYAGDCARAIAIALEKRTGPDPINLGTGHEITIRDLAILIKHLGDYDAEIVWDETKPDGQPRRCLDVSRAEKVLRWKATTSLEQMLCKTIDWYREQKKDE